MNRRKKEKEKEKSQPNLFNYFLTNENEESPNTRSPIAMRRNGLKMNVDVDGDEDECDDDEDGGISGSRKFLSFGSGLTGLKGLYNSPQSGSSDSKSNDRSVITGA